MINMFIYIFGFFTLSMTPEALNPVLNALKWGLLSVLFTCCFMVFIGAAGCIINKLNSNG